jgi:hypothetical protein
MGKTAIVPWEADDFEGELAEMGSLPSGWCGGSGEAIGAASVVTMRDVLILLRNLDMPKPRVYPTPDGGLQCEWDEVFGEVKACANGTVDAWADLDPETLPSRDETMWTAKGPAVTALAIVESFSKVVALIAPPKDAHGALVREIKAHPTTRVDTDGIDDVGKF